MPRKPSLDAKVPPVIAVDPGQAATAVLVRIGTRLVDACVVTNPEPAKMEIGAHARDLSPEYGYLAHIRAAITHYRHIHDAEARDFWDRRRTPVPDAVSPWLLAIEKVNYPSLLPGKVVTEVETGSVFAPKGIADGIAGWWGPERVVWVRPVHCDDRFEVRHGGTGDPFDYFPAEILPGMTRGADGEWPSLDHPRFRAQRIKDLAAAWSIAADGALDFAHASYNRHKTVVPPHAAPEVFDDLLANLRAYKEAKT